MMIISHLYLFHCSRMHRTATRAESIYRREYEKLWWDEEEFCDSKLLHLRWLLKSSPCLKYSESTFSHCNFWEEARPINDTFFWVTWDPWTIIHTISSDHETGGAGAQAVHGSCYWESACRIGQCPSMRILWLRYCCEVLIACAQDASLSRSVICFSLPGQAILEFCSFSFLLHVLVLTCPLRHFVRVRSLQFGIIVW
jgi:hypothetical protein